MKLYRFLTGPDDSSFCHKVSAALTRVLGEPQVRKQLEALGADVVASDPAQLSAFVNEEIAKWTKVAHTAHLKLD